MNSPIDPGFRTTISARELFGLRALRDLGVLLLLVTVTLLAILNLSSPRIPFVYSGDALGYGGTIRTMLETGWVQHTPRLGAPFGQNMADMPLGGDNGNYLLFKVLSLFTSDWGLLLNLFFVLGFYCTATSAWFCTRLLGGSRVLSICVAMLFDFAQYHFWRYGHVLLANYFVIPIAVALAVRAAQGSSFRAPGLSRSRWAALVGSVLACAAVGSFGAYYAVFAVMTVGFMCAAAALVLRTIRPLLHGAAVCAVVVVVMVANQLPTLLFQSANGGNDFVATRNPTEQDLYSLRLIELITPTPSGHFNNGWLRHLTGNLLRGYTTEESEFLGLVGAVVFLCMLSWMVVRVLRPVGRPEAASPVAGTVQLLATTSVFWVLFATAGGLDWGVWVLGFQSMRGWGRVSILIMFMTLAWGALLIGRWQSNREKSWSRGRRLSVGVLMVGVAVVGVLEETPSRFPTEYGQQVASYQSDKVYFAQLESQLPPKTAVFNLPIRRFPEEPPTAQSGDYAMLVPFADTKTLRFSYGGMKGRQSEWQQYLNGATPNQLVPAVASVGFRALLIDTYGYGDRGKATIAAYSQLLNASPIVSQDGRWVAFSLHAWLSNHPPSVALHNQLLDTPQLVPGPCASAGARAVQQAGGQALQLTQTCPAAGKLMITTPVPTSDQQVTLELTSPNGPGTFSIKIRGRWTTVDVGRAPVQVQLTAGSNTYTYFDYRADTPLIRQYLGTRLYVNVSTTLSPLATS